VKPALEGNFHSATKADAITELGLTPKQARNISALTPELVDKAIAVA
jgi:hypothetical protein